MNHTTTAPIVADGKPEHLRLIGAPNFRDFGGATTLDGRRVRRGLLYRSERLSLLSDDDLERLRPLGIGLVCDLRGERERLRHPSRWPEDHAPEKLELNLSADLRAGNEKLHRLIEADPGPRGMRMMMIETYRMLPATAAPGLRRLFERLAAGAAPVLIHCTAGKDRTGFFCACLLHALGVAREDIFSDYLLSAERIDLDALGAATADLVQEVFGFSLEPDALMAVNSVAPEYLAAAYTAAAERYGSFEAYLESVGLDAAMRERLHTLLLQ